MASIQRVASTFFNAIDKKEGSPYVFQGEKRLVNEISPSEPADDSDEEELDRFIAEIEDAADREWAEEEAAEKEEADKIRYWNKDFREKFKRLGNRGEYGHSDDDEVRSPRGWKDTKHGKRAPERDSGALREREEDGWASGGSEDLEDYADDSDEDFERSKGANKNTEAPQSRNAQASFAKIKVYESEEIISDLCGNLISTKGGILEGWTPQEVIIIEVVVMKKKVFIP